MEKKSNVKNAVSLIMEEARAEMLKESRSKYVAEIKQKMTALAQAKQLVRNCEREIEDLEMRINDELA